MPVKTRAISVVLIALLCVGCSRAVEIPRQQLEAQEYRKVGSYKVRLHGWNEYNVRRFSMTDSTVVIEELLVTDDRYKLKKHDMPIVVPREDVEYIAAMETNKPLTTAVLVGAAAGIVYMTYVALLLSGMSHSN